MEDILIRFKKCEIQVGLSVRHFYRRRIDFDKEILKKFSIETFGKYLLDFDEGFKQLLKKEIITKKNNKLTLNNNGVSIINEFQKIHPIWIYYYNDFYAAAEESEAFNLFASNTFGLNLYQQGQMDLDQLKLLLSRLGLKDSNSVFDLGCGNGYITEYISDSAKCKILGIDISEIAISSAINRTQSKSDLITFSVGNVNNLSLIKEKFDYIISIDTLHLCSDLEETMNNLRALVNPNGKLAIFWESWIRENIDESNLNHKNTRLGKVVRQMKLKYQVDDLSKELKKHWISRKDNLLNLEQQFYAEGNNKLYNILLDETKRLDWGRGSRFLYLIDI